MNPSQDPCTVAAYLQAPCFSGSESLRCTPHSLADRLEFGVGSISEGYYTPAGNGSDTCACSSVAYSMISACGICQGATDST